MNVVDVKNRASGSFPFRASAKITADFFRQSVQKLPQRGYDTMFGIFADSILVAADEGTTLKLDLDLERWSVVDAAELYEVARWGNGYFSINDDGHVCVHPTKDPERSIDLKKLVDRLAAARHRSADPDSLRRYSEASAGGNSHHLPDGDGGAEVSGRLLLRVSDQGEPAAAGGRRGAGIRQAVQIRLGSRQQAGAVGRGGDGLATTRRSSATDSRMPSSSKRRCSPTRSAATLFRWSRNTPSWG